MKLTTLLLLSTSGLAQALPGIPPYEIHTIFPAKGSNSSQAFKGKLPPNVIRPPKVINSSLATNSSTANLLAREWPLTEKTPIPSGQIFCHKKPNWVAPMSDYHNAISLLFDAPQFFIPQNSVRYALYGDSVVYICNPTGINTGSLLEFMQAMDEIDAQCGQGKPGKRVLKDWGKYYGRTVRGGTICGLEGNHKDPTGHRVGIPNDLEDKVKAGCKSHLSGFLSVFDGWKDKPVCYDSTARMGKLKKLRGLFPWWKRGTDFDGDYEVPYIEPEEDDQDDGQETQGQGKGEENEHGEKGQDSNVDRKGRN
ncbi:unnamed protein product [Clonostachys byssicola]|uniref:Uncharacterized protein n=1 Tax=Clonostachys byssicola TaxID=160290 RepID=A0A9N9UJL7_9HYPO|nr:unnamed protein product [Clonostachys byssicola]